MPIDKRLLVKIAYYYYEHNLTQEQIAKKLSMSRQKVNRLFSQLIDEGIVTIRINDFNYHVDIESKLEKKFNLKQVIVTPQTENPVDLLDSIGKAGAKFLEETISPNSVIGVAWGRALSEVAKHLAPIGTKNVSIVQLVGGMTHADISVQLNEVHKQSGEIARSFADKLRATPYYMNSPAFVENEKIKDSLMQEQSIKNSFEMIKKCEIGLVGIGALSENVTPFKNGHLPLTELDSLRSLGAVGNICFRYFDIHGNPVPNSLDAKTIGPRLEYLKKIPLLIGVAGGPEKYNAILGALNGGFLDTLITDYESALHVLNNA